MRASLLIALFTLAACAPEVPTTEAPAGEAPAGETHAPAGEAHPIAVPAGLDVLDGTVYVPGGTTTIGTLADEGGIGDERPAFDTDVAPFLLDRSPVTVEAFRAFAVRTRFVTEAERLGDGAVLDQATGRWALVAGATWRRPFGPGRPEASADHPVTQVSWSDAEAFCAAVGGRLPTEVEWEHAARGGVNDRSRYAWGDRLGAGRHAHANTWTGTLPAAMHPSGHGTNTGADDAADGFGGTTSPVGAFGATPLGLTDMGGNVWEWTASWFQPYPLGADQGAGTSGPAGPTGAPERVQRGGSFLCNPAYCHGYRVSARSHATPESSFAHVGFRCATPLRAARGA